MSSVGTVLGFMIDWFDPVSSIVHTMYLKFFLNDNTIEIMTEKSAFLKRIYYPDVKISDLFLGSTITIHHRLYTVSGYANQFTQQFMRAREVHFVALIDSQSIGQVARVLVAAKKHKLSMGHIITTSSPVFCEQLIANPGDTIVEVVGNVSTAGHYDAFLRELRNDVSITQLTPEAITAVFKDCRGQSVLGPCTLCIIKPHVIRDGRVGELIQYLQDQSSAFRIAALYSVHLTSFIAEEIFQSYRGVLADYAQSLTALCSGPSLAIAIVPAANSRGNSASSGGWAADSFGADIVTQFREFTGPVDPQVAKVLRPKSLRAIFGKNMIDNAVHCTDLPEDGEMECRFFFQTLPNLA